MNRFYLTLILSMLVFALGAQTGLFELSFGENRDEAMTKLTSLGYSIANEDSYGIELVDTESTLVESIHLTLDPEDSTLIGWSVTYLEQENDDIEDMVMDALISWHGSDYYFDEEYLFYHWDLGDGYFVEAGYSWDYEVFWVDYTFTLPDDLMDIYYGEDE